MSKPKPRENANTNCPCCNRPWGAKTEEIGGHRLLSCSNCGLVFFNPAELASVDYNEVYESEGYQEHFDTLAQTACWNEFAEYPTYKPFFLKVPNGANSKLLDIGCGVGRFCRGAYSRGWDVKGIDVSEVAISKGAPTAPFPLLNATVEDFVESGEQFDAVTAFEVLEHIITPVTFLKNVSKLVKKGGVFFCTVPNAESRTVRTAMRRDWLPPIHVLFLNRAALHQALVQSGFTDVQTGLIWVNERPVRLGLLVYYLKKVLGKAKEPDPLGLWALGVKP